MVSACCSYFSYKVICRAVVYLGGPDPWYNWGGPSKVGARKSFLFTGSSLVVQIENTRLLLFSHYIQVM